MDGLNSLELINGQIAEDKFARLHRQARVASLWNHLTGRSGTLLSYTDLTSRRDRFTRLDRGVKEIPVKSIVGSLSRTEDYDRQFRPLNPVLKERWINVHVLTESLGWEPITVYKVGDWYFVEDGHHRVSIARHSGWETIEARVYEIPVFRACVIEPAPTPTPRACPARLPPAPNSSGGIGMCATAR
jgi:hypothetical protein